jgi:antirestriction protein ArdC
MKRDIYTEVSARIAAELEAGAAPWVKPWASMPGMGTPHNASTGRPYSGCNVVLLWMASAAARWATPRFLTFKQALDLGGNVRKGEKGTKVYFVKQMQVRDTSEPAGSDEATRVIPMMREYTVFNVAQCENLPARVLDPAAKAPRNKDQRDVIADEFLAATGADIREGHGEAFYVPSKDFVSMPAFAAFNGADQFYNVVFHELGHWTGAKHRLDRDLKGRFGERAYAAEELVAELCAAFLAAEFSFNGDVRHAGYIATWAKLLRDDSRAFFTACSKAQAAADYLRGLAIAEPVAEAA